MEQENQHHVYTLDTAPPPPPVIVRHESNYNFVAARSTLSFPTIDVWTSIGSRADPRQRGHRGCLVQDKGRSGGEHDTSHGDATSNATRRQRWRCGESIEEGSGGATITSRSWCCLPCVPRPTATSSLHTRSHLGLHLAHQEDMGRGVLLWGRP